MNVFNTSLLDKYVLFNGIYSKEDSIKGQLFYIIDIIYDPKDKFNYALKSVKIKRFEIWAKIEQITVLEEKDQIIARTLYGK